MSGLNPTWLFHQSTLFSINCGYHAAIYFFCLFLLLTVEIVVLNGVLDVKELVLPVVPVDALNIVEDAVVVTTLVVMARIHADCGTMVALVLAVVITVLTVATVLVVANAPTIVLINVAIAKVTATPVVLVPPMQDFKYN